MKNVLIKYIGKAYLVRFGFELKTNKSYRAVINRSEICIIDNFNQKYSFCYCSSCKKLYQIIAIPDKIIIE